MNNANDDTIGLIGTDCRKLKYIFDIDLVDELGQPVTNVPYTLTIASGMTRTGVSDGAGKILETDLRPGTAVLTLDPDVLIKVMQEPHRTLNPNRDPQQSTIKDQVEAAGRELRYAKVGQLIDTLPTIVDWQHNEQGEPMPLPEYHFPDATPKGYQIDFIGKHQKRQDITIEICPFRAWVLALHHGPEYSLVNAYNLALMSVLSYANDGIDEHGSALGSVNHFFGKALLDLSRPPFKVNAAYQAVLVKDVPFDERYSQFAFIDSSSKLYEEVGDTQLFYAANKTEVIIAWRGTAGFGDVLTDINAIQTDASQFTGRGNMHLGFKQAYDVMRANEKLENVMINIDKLIAGKQLFLTGHSLGGALALIDATEKSDNNPILYTYGMPRVFDSSATAMLTDLIHYRHINADDLVPSIPKPSWTLKKVMLAGMWGSQYLPQTDDDYAHQGRIVHFVEARNVGFESNAAQQGWMGSTVNTQQQTIKLLLAPDPIGVNCQRGFDLLCQQYSRQELDNPAGKGANFLDHSSLLYADYLRQRLIGKLQAEQGEVSEFEQTKADFVTRANNAATQTDNQAALVLARADSLLLQQPTLPASETAQMTAAYAQFLHHAKALPIIDIERDAVALIEQTNHNLATLQEHPITQYQQDQLYLSPGQQSKQIKPTVSMFKEFEELKQLYTKQQSGIIKIMEIIQ